MKKKIKISIKAILLMFVITIVAIGIYILYSSLQLTKINPDSDSSFKWPYYLYINNNVKRQALSGEKVNILVLPNNSMGVTDDFKKDDFMAKFTAIFGKTVFGDLNTIILVPIFPRPMEHNLIYTHALDRDVFTTDVSELYRLDLQLLAMIDDVTEIYKKDGWNIESKVLMWGFSASAMYVNRFSIIHPDRVQAVSIGSPGGWPIAPSKTWEGKILRYPVGIADLDILTGDSINLEGYKRIPQLFFLGDEDTNDSVPYDESFDQADQELVNGLFGDTPVARWGIAESIYESIDANVQFRLYKKVGHRPTLKSIIETKDLFRKVMNME
ncbi:MULTISPECIES: hypothetical protein [unclassified Sedimentibacter]|uniref:hypothetical protein n=1 Tax=unclassified Sedimentibacter TaxID=2649220 RepID=UPI0027E0E002|nr:hypothetical protein [Sedimentibacter sp. MB35-C1]WMJ76966.1 hypothetical protein RBQ61_15530 [Sedimentibacter sp. MB35-C1]